MHDLCPNCAWNELRLVLGQGTKTYHYCHASDIAALRTSVNVFSYDKVFGQDSNPSPTRQRANGLHVASWSRFKLKRILSSIYTKHSIPYPETQIHWLKTIY